ncbi:MAG: molybdenum cofactor guanylyltransferase [Acidimicrobiia bacterium]|nr:molybdenum cofactor guanylyltransferase [Acidimicrobiia bacterium]
MARTIGVILAGGRSSRMGTDKASVEVGSSTMLDHVGQALGQVADEIVVAGRSEPIGGYPVLADPGVPHRGPLAGLAAAATAHATSDLVVVAVDQPWVRPETLTNLVATARDLPVLPVDGGIRQTTCAVYPAGSLPGISEELAGGGSIQSLLDRISFEPITESAWQAWGEDGRSWFSADTMAAVAVGIDRYGLP